MGAGELREIDPPEVGIPDIYINEYKYIEMMLEYHECEKTTHGLIIS